MNNETQWYETHENMVALATALDDNGYFCETKDVVRYLEKPWKWTPEWERWTKAGRPAVFNFDEPAPIEEKHWLEDVVAELPSGPFRSLMMRGTGR